MSKVYPLEQTGQAALDVHRNLHHGKVAVLCLAPREGLGVRDHQLRDKHLTEINRFRSE
jgi:crotonyl-CoA reductase